MAGEDKFGDFSIKLTMAKVSGGHISSDLFVN
jgi:hypothetical protein